MDDQTGALIDLLEQHVGEFGVEKCLDALKAPDVIIATTPSKSPGAFVQMYEKYSNFYESVRGGMHEYHGVDSLLSRLYVCSMSDIIAVSVVTMAWRFMVFTDPKLECLIGITYSASSARFAEFADIVKKHQSFQ